MDGDVALAAGMALANIAILVAMVFAANAISVAGGVLVARLMRLRVHEVTIGWGRVLLRRTLGGVPVTVRYIPIFSAMPVSAEPSPFIILRAWITMASVPLTNIVVWLLLTTATRRGGPLFDRTGWEGLFIWQAAIDASVFVLVFSLLLPVPGALLRWLVTAPFRRRVIREAMLGLPYVERAKLQGANLRVALDQVEAGLRVAPEAVVLLVARALLMIALKDFAAARVQLTSLLARQDLRKPELQNNLAWACVMLGDAAAADEPSAAAFAASPMSPAICNTRGVVLIELGELEDGCEMLRRAQRWGTKPAGRAIDAIWLAIGEARLGHEAVAREHLELALQLDPEVEFVDRAKAAIASIGAST